MTGDEASSPVPFAQMNTLRTPQGTFRIQVHPRARHLRIVLRPFAPPAVTIPPGAGEPVVRRFLAEKNDWIQRYQNLQCSREERTLERIRQVGRGFPEEIDTRLGGLFESLARANQLEYRRLSFRQQRTRWGSCSSKGHISLNRALILLPRNLQDYVCLHELIHVEMPHHRSAFWKRLKEVLPDLSGARKELGTYAIPPGHFFIRGV